jgi:hypothetical protein
MQLTGIEGALQLCRDALRVEFKESQASGRQNTAAIIKAGQFLNLAMTAIDEARAIKAIVKPSSAENDADAITSAFQAEARVKNGRCRKCRRVIKNCKCEVLHSA